MSSDSDVSKQAVVISWILFRVKLHGYFFFDI